MHMRLTWMAAVFAAATTAISANAQRFSTPASHAVIMDYATGIVLFDKNANVPTPPASMSKIMTALYVFEHVAAGAVSLDTVYTASEDAWRRGSFRTGSSTMCLDPGEEATVEELLRGIIVLSGNDAAITLAENLGGSEPEFAKLMEARGAELGLTGTSLANATGWPDPEQLMSMRDLAEVARITIRDHPELYAYYAEPEFGFCTEAPSNRFNRNPLLGMMEGADGLKTGHTTASGYGLVASREWNGVRRIVVFNGMESARDRAREAERLMRAAFDDFRVAPLFAAGDWVGAADVHLGDAKTVPLAIREEIVAGFHRLDARDITATVTFEGPLRAPVRAGDEVGVLTVRVPGQEPITTPVYTAADVSRLGWRDRALAAAAHIIRTAGTDEGA